jgi:hypothetical protein
MGSFLDRFDFSIDATKMDGTSWAIIGLALLLLAACGLGSIYVQRHLCTVAGIAGVSAGLGS